MKKDKFDYYKCGYHIAPFLPDIFANPQLQLMISGFRADTQYELKVKSYEYFMGIVDYWADQAIEKSPIVAFDNIWKRDES